jgi:tRNA(Ile)-lysidine synthase
MTDLLPSLESDLIETLPDAGTAVVVAVSGGVDSCALLDLLVRVDLWPLVVFHLDHGLRDESSEDARFVADRVAHYQQQSDRKNLAAEIRHHDIAAQAQAWGVGLEEAGRRWRYQTLEAVARSAGAAAVVTAHHRGDQVETILANILRGAGPMGVVGMPRCRELAPGIDLIRPLLDFAKDDLTAYLDSQGLDWREDASNTDRRFNRNRLRLDVLPALEAGAPGFADELLASARAIEADVRQRNTTLTQTLSDNRERDSLLLEPVLALEEADRLLLWRILVRELTLPMTRQTLKTLDDLATGRPGRSFELGGMAFSVGKKRLFWEAIACDTGLQIPVALTGQTRRGDEHLTMRVLEPPVDVHAMPLECFIDLDRLQGELVWRTVIEGERWVPLGAEGSKPLLRFLAERGWPRHRRRRQGVLADDQGVVWIPGATIADRVQIDSRSGRILHGFLERPGDDW